jgi:hypothetical protein
LIRVVGPSLERKYTNMRKNILVKGRITMVIIRLCIGNSLQMCEKVYGIVESTTSIIVQEFWISIQST